MKIYPSLPTSKVVESQLKRKLIKQHVAKISIQKMIDFSVTYNSIDDFVSEISKNLKKSLINSVPKDMNVEEVIITPNEEDYSFGVFCNRYETDKEYDRRTNQYTEFIHRNSKQKEEQEKKEFELYLRLKSKYENKETT